MHSLSRFHCLYPTVMAGLVPAIHVLRGTKTWMPGTRPGMTIFVWLPLRKTASYTSPPDSLTRRR
jgi:hypothetical protein